MKKLVMTACFVPAIKFNSYWRIDLSNVPRFDAGDGHKNFQKRGFNDKGISRVQISRINTMNSNAIQAETDLY